MFLMHDDDSYHIMSWMDADAGGERLLKDDRDFSSTTRCEIQARGGTTGRHTIWNPLTIFACFAAAEAAGKREEEKRAATTEHQKSQAHWHSHHIAHR